MALGLGIDTGGTFTDAVLVELETQEIRYTAKASTTRENLAVGICGALSKLPADQLPLVEKISLSTTLATNACVEDKGGRARLILIGGYPKVVEQVGPEYGLPPAKEIVFLAGGCDRTGQVVQEPDFDALLAITDEWVGSVDAVAVVEHQGVANPTFERKTKELLESRYGIPVICGHELFQEYNMLGRAASALLNARLIVVIRDFLAAIGASLQQRGIDAPSMIVRSDGSLMAEHFAMQRPIDTILCGPAASVLGGVHLTGEPNALLVDMGGTTTDIAVVREGVPVPTVGGVQIGAWRTFVQSVQIDTVGLGGDSIVTRNKDGSLQIGPRRAVPLCIAAMRYPYIRQELEEVAQHEIRSTHPMNEYLFLLRDISEDTSYSEQERALCRILRDGPKQIDKAAQAIGSDYYRLSYAKLEATGAVIRCALTATDIMHIQGDFTQYDTEASKAGAAFLAYNLDMTVEALAELVYDRIREALYVQCASLLLRIEHPDVFGNGLDPQLEKLIRKSWKQAKEGNPFFGFRFTTPAVCVGLGAPTHIFLEEVAKALGTRCVIPQHAPVANAVGAIMGSVAARHTIEIKPVYGPGGIDGYHLYGGDDRLYLEDLDEAKQKAMELALIGAEREARRRGVIGALECAVQDTADTVRLGQGGEEAQEMFLGMKVTATAKGTL